MRFHGCGKGKGRPEAARGGYGGRRKSTGNGGIGVCGSSGVAKGVKPASHPSQIDRRASGHRAPRFAVAAKIVKSRVIASMEGSVPCARGVDPTDRGRGHQRAC